MASTNLRHFYTIRQMGNLIESLEGVSLNGHLLGVLCRGYATITLKMSALIWAGPKDYRTTFIGALGYVVVFK